MLAVYAKYLLWVIVAPATSVAAMFFIARVTLYPPITATLNGLLLVAIGFATTRFLPGYRLIKLALLLLIPIAAMIFWARAIRTRI